MQPLRITIWNESVHERQNAAVATIYPGGIHRVLAEVLGRQEGVSVRTATLDEPDQGLPPAVLDSTDVLLWWGHAAHEAVTDELAVRVQERVLAGMGLLVLHSGHESKAQPDIQRVITNGVFWARPQGRPAGVPRHVPVEQARQPLVAKGPSVHDAAGRLTPPRS